MWLWRAVLGSFALTCMHCWKWSGSQFDLELEWIARWLVLASFWFAVTVAWELSAGGAEPRPGGAHADPVNVMIPYRIGLVIWLAISWTNTRTEDVVPLHRPGRVEIASAIMAGLWCAALAAYDVVAAETRRSAVCRLLAYHLLACVALGVAAAHATTPWSEEWGLQLVSFSIAAAISGACLLAARHRRILLETLRTPPPIPAARAVSGGGARSLRA